MTEKLAIRFFGNYYRLRRNDYPSLRDTLIKADMRISVEEWLSQVTLYALVCSFLFFPAFVLASRIGFGYFLVWDIMTKLSSAVPEDFIRLAGEFSFLGMFLVIPYFISFLLIYRYPGVRIWERKRKIDAFLPYAIGWMSSLASVGIVPYEIFKKLSETEEYYGEVSKEARRLIRDVEMLGFDFLTALRNLASVTPSQRFRAFLQGAITSSLSGGEMGSYFIHKAEENMEENRRKFSDFIQTLGMLSELYITGLVAGPLFIIVMFSAMMLLSGASPMILQVLIYAVIPLGSIMFILLTDSMTPQGM